MRPQLTLTSLTLALASLAVLLFLSHTSAQDLAAVPRFEDVAKTSGLRFTHENGARGEYFMPEMMGAGVALFDYDGDGDLDVFVVQGTADSVGRLGSVGRAGSPSRPTPPSAATRTQRHGDGRFGDGPLGERFGDGRLGEPALPYSSRLFRNDLDRPGDTLRFTDVTDEAGVGLVAQGMGVAVGDYDNDGDLDLYVTTFGDNVLYRNEGNGRFTDVTAAAGVNDPRWSTSAAFVDYDRDGHLDLFLTNYVDFTPANNKRCTEPAGARDYCSPLAYQPVPARLYRNRGDGTFEDASERAGITRAFGNGLGVAIGDYDGDGWPDIYVANDATANQLWMNRRDETFEDMGPLSGSAYNAAGRPEGSMGIASGDYDRDGDEDLVVTNLVGETFVLYDNDGSGAFEDRRAVVGLAAATAAMTGFGTDWFDADNDGWLDLFVANGAVNLIPSLRGTPTPYRQRNQLFMSERRAQNAERRGSDGAGNRETGTGNRESPGRTRSPSAPSPRPGDGRLGEASLPSRPLPRDVRLIDVTAQAGPGLEPLGVGRGAAFGDLDNDGRVDIVVTNNAGPVQLLRNVTPQAGHWLRLRLRQPGGNRYAVGATVRVDGQNGAPLVRRVGSAGSYLSASDLRVHLGLGASTDRQTVIVTWPDGTSERFSDLAVDREHVLTRTP